jgi:hypothetical protein
MPRSQAFGTSLTFGGWLAMATIGNLVLIGTPTQASEQDECVRVTAVGSGFNRKIVVSTTCNRPSKEVNVYCGMPGGYVTQRVVRVWPGRDVEVPCDGRPTSNGSSAQWCYLIQARSDERCL